MFLDAKGIVITSAVIIVALVIMIVVIYFIYKIIKKNQTTKMYQAIESLLLKFVELDKENNQYTKIEKLKNDNLPYDFTLTTKKSIFYIMIVKNAFSDEICINNSVKWQKGRPQGQENAKFFNDIDKLMRVDLPKTEGKKTRKLYIIYPNARLLLKYINECEMEFVYPITDVYGTNVVTYFEFKDDINIPYKIEEEAEKKKNKI